MVSVGGQVFIGSQGTLIFSALVFLLGIFLELRMKLHPILLLLLCAVLGVMAGYAGLIA